MNEDLDIKKTNMKKWLTIGGIGLVGLIVSPIIFLTIQGLIGLAIAGIVGFTIVSFTPVIAAMISNAKYRILDAEKVNHIKKVETAAHENPIETLTALLMAKKVAFEQFKLSVTQAATARDNFKGKVQKFSQDYPARAPEFQAQLVRMSDLVERKKTALLDAQRSLKDGDSKLEEMKAYWEMSKDAIAANRAAGMDTGDVFEKFKADTACDSVFESMNKAFSELEIASALNDNPSDKSQHTTLQLDHNNASLDINMHAIPISQKVII